MKILQPVQRAGEQKALYFAPTEIVDEGIPVAMKAFARVEMLVERGAVEPGQPVRIGGKMRRNPVENNANARGMQRAHTKRHYSRRSVAAAWSKQAQRLISPRAAKRMFCDR